MTLQGLLAIGQLEEHEATAAEIFRMLAASERSITDARNRSISPETRLDSAYRAITQLCMVALWAKGFRPARHKPGHHQIMIQSLVHAVGLDRDRMVLLDTLRVKRNAIDYTGEDVDEASVDECIEAASALQEHVRQWLAGDKPELSAVLSGD